MENINQYKERFFDLMESKIGNVRPLIAEQKSKEIIKSSPIFDENDNDNKNQIEIWNMFHLEKDGGKNMVKIYYKGSKGTEAGYGEYYCGKGLVFSCHHNKWFKFDDETTKWFEDNYCEPAI